MIAKVWNAFTTAVLWGVVTFLFGGIIYLSFVLDKTRYVHCG